MGECRHPTGRTKDVEIDAPKPDLLTLEVSCRMSLVQKTTSPRLTPKTQTQGIKLTKTRGKSFISRKDTKSQTPGHLSRKHNPAIGRQSGREWSLCRVSYFVPATRGPAIWRSIQSAPVSPRLPARGPPGFAPSSPNGVSSSGLRMGIGLSYSMAVRDTVRDGLGKMSARDLSYASVQVLER